MALGSGDLGKVIKPRGLVLVNGISESAGWFCQLAPAWNTVGRESHLRNCLDQVGLWTCLGGIFLRVD